MDKVPYRFVRSVGFVPYSSDEIKKISVMEITNSSVFDALDHPADGGLYDRRLGPVEMNDLCSTCGLNSFHCPGHCGHISLPLPVFHPLFLGTVNKLLRGSCLTCHRITAPTRFIQLVLHQFDALDYGLIGTVQELQEVVCEPTSAGKSKSSMDLSLGMTRKLSEILQQAISDVNLEEARASSRVKNVVETRQRLMKSFIKDHFMASGGKCPHCGVKKKKILLKNNCCFVINQGTKSAPAAVSARMIKQERGTEEDATNAEASDNMAACKDFSAKDVRAHLCDLWNNDGALLGRLFGVLRATEEFCASPMDMFFIDVVLVPPSRFRPINVIKNRKLMSPHTASLRDVLQDCLLLNCLALKMKGVKVSDAEEEILSKLKGTSNDQKLHLLWYSLQGHVNVLLDAQMDKQMKDKRKIIGGVKQVLEAKEGLFRGHMMGKRVNYVARSVISPDPFIMADEIGVPEVFAKKLTYPEPVTPWNVEKLRAIVLNGPDVHPGAVAVESEDGIVTRLTNERMRYSFAARLLTPESRRAIPMRPKIVHRHLQNGDVLLLNRQPTLHKPSIMAHRARVLPREKTLRLHYANCKSYNADFDGDEMNAHFPQNELGRAEGYNVVSVNHQYLVPKDGTPLSGLIQDHIVAGTLLTMRGRFFTRDRYEQMVYNAIPYVQKIKTLPPSIIKPQNLWSGKQIISTVLINVIPKGKQPITVEGKAKLSSKNWQNSPRRDWTAGGILEDDDMTESQVIIRSGELLCGVLDKAQIGPTPYGLVHCCYELYGGETSNLLLTSLSRLFTYFLQTECSFTLGIEDILLTPKAEEKRKKMMHKAKKKKVGDEAAMEALGVPSGSDSTGLLAKMRDAHLNRDDLSLKRMDFEMKKITDNFNNKINKICMPDGLEKKFPRNNLQLLVQAGAKGTTVNTMQISCLLGQVELEGRRVPLMLNGSTLPSFLPYDSSPRAGGFVDGRFLTGIEPPEYFFHCMAGREGLIDTAVKTSRSGYLQRCLIKHLEGITVNYDLTVRDSDGSVIQFLYGEDGLDVTKMQMLKPKQFSTLAKNYDVAINTKEVELLKVMQNAEELHKHKKAVSRWKKKNGTTLGSQMNRLSISNFTKKRCPDPVISAMKPDRTLGSVSEHLDDLVEKYIKDNPDGLINSRKQFGHKLLNREMFRNMIHYRALKALAPAGEPVGLLAAQSIGEPSTQMTLNTFHYAGRGEMNVTLGIPRLREILMVASANIATPSMTLPLLKVPDLGTEAEKLRVEFTAVSLKQVLEHVEIIDKIHVISRSECFREYKVKMKFLPFEAYAAELQVTPEKILQFIEEKFIKKVVDALKKKLASKSKASLVNMVASRENRHGDQSDSEADYPPESPEEGEDAGASSDEEAGDDDTMAAKVRSRHTQDVDYEEAEDEDKIDEPSDEEEPSPQASESVLETGVELIDSEEAKVPVQSADKASRINRIKGIHRWISSYDYSTKKNRCEFSLKLDLQGSSTDMKTLVEEEISKAVVHEVPKIKRAFVVQKRRPDGEEETLLQTEGVNFLETFKYDHIVDMKKTYSNDIHAIANFLGIEAAAKVIVKEITNVFGSYGIQVDPRHLLLIADYMTFDGSYKPFNRVGLESSASPLQQMSFETPIKFFTNATLTGSEDMLKSPSSKLVVGQLVGGGTGSFDLFTVPYMMKKKK